jgi:hypothetical protein
VEVATKATARGNKAANRIMMKGCGAPVSPRAWRQGAGTRERPGRPDDRPIPHSGANRPRRNVECVPRPRPAPRASRRRQDSVALPGP